MELTRRAFVKGTVAAAALAAMPAMAVADVLPDDADKAEVVVIGAGGAGMTCAIKAVEAGLLVTVLEKEPIVGGNTRIASTSFTCAGAQVQKDAGMDNATPDALYESLMNDKKDPEAVRILADRSGEAADFFTSIGMDLTRCWGFSCGRADGSAPGIMEVEVLEARMQELGIDYRVDSCVTKILRGDDGAVLGVEVSSPDGDYTIAAPVVVLASGGFAANNELITEFDPRWEGLTYSCGAQATGEGTLVAIDAGAAVSNMDNVRVNPTAYYIDEATAVSLAPVRINGCIMVATNASEQNSGKRILNEEGDYTTNSAIIVENGGTTYMVFDKTLFDEVAAVRGFVENGWAASADTLEELADQIEVDKDAFLQTCATWAEYFAAGEDPDFGKKTFITGLTEPPFYAIHAKPAVQGTFGGVTTDVAAEVLDESGAVIPGFYACGECADEGTYGSAPTTVNLVFGTIAAESAGEYLA